MNVELTIKGEIQTLALKPGAVLVVRVDEPLDMQQADELRRRVKGVFPDNDVIVLAGDISFEVAVP